MKKVLGLVTSFNRKEKTVNAIRSLFLGNPNLEFDFIVVDDLSTDGTAQALQMFEQVTVVQGNGSLFYSGGMRLAIDEAQKREKKYDYCLLFNDDVSFFEKTIEALSSKSEHVVWVGPTCDKEGEITYGGVIKQSNWRPKYKTIKATTENGEKCDTFNANCVLVPWEIFVNLENIDPVYVHAMGDYDFGFSIARKGIEIRVAREYVGECGKNTTKGTWQDKSLPLKKRINLKERPKGLPIKQWFYFLKKNHSVFTAILFSITPYMKILFKK